MASVLGKVLCTIVDLLLPLSSGQANPRYCGALFYFNEPTASSIHPPSGSVIRLVLCPIVSPQVPRIHPISSFNMFPKTIFVLVIASIGFVQAFPAPDTRE